MHAAKTYRLRNYRVTPDETALPSYQAVCVSGEEADCGADSTDQPDEEALTRWMAEHTRDTGHDRFKRA
ncbi:hypothetical protein [Streptomyces sp. NPDC096153]|uniref:DUF7848 domain-containing protein n=1 Tax=Streptomyces sp. NPDC096153 TaxID=3155548 RepID=UPI00331F1C6C